MKKILSLLLCIILTVSVLGINVTVSAAEAGKTVYVSSSGSDNNDGSKGAPFATVQKAWSNSDAVDYTITIVDTVTLDDSSFVFGGQNKALHTTIKGETASSVLDLTAKTALGLYCNGGLTLDNLKINFTADAEFAANGRKLLITETVTFSNRIKLYGGGRNNDITGDTDITVLGGIYTRIYGGGFSGSVSGNVNLTVGGRVNPNDGIDDEVSNPPISPCQIYGGCYGGSVNGNVTVNYGGNAVSRYVAGAGAGSGEIGGNIYINVTGGKVTTVCSTRSLYINDANVFINITGGLIESVFGGGESCGITGNTQVYIGGQADISRRVHGGSYNESTSSGTSRVVGSATVIIDTGCKLASGTELSSWNRFEMGINGGSRLRTDPEDEHSVIVFLNGSYSSYSSKLSSRYKQDHVVKAAPGGKVTGSAIPGSLTILPDNGKVAVINSKLYESGSIYALSAADTDITFKDIDQEASYTVRFNPDNTGVANSEFVKVGDSLVLPITDHVKKGYEFIGWTTEAGSNTAEYVAGDVLTPAMDMVLYGVWGIPVNYTVMHYVETDTGYQLYKVESRKGHSGQLTDAEPLKLLGYTADITQEMLNANETFMLIATYTKGETVIYDVNCDRSIDMMDIVLLERSLAGWPGYDASRVCSYNADCNADGTVDIADAVILKRFLAGWENP